MSSTARVFLALAISSALGGAVTALVRWLVGRQSSESTRQPTHPGVTFIVCSRRWQARVLAWTGVALVVVAGVLVVLAVAVPSSSAGAAIPGVFLAVIGIVFLWLARATGRARLEVATGTIWVHRWRGRPRQVEVGQINRLSPMTRNRYGGLVAHSAHRRVFSANRLMLGYPQLVDHLHATRPDLLVPRASEAS